MKVSDRIIVSILESSAHGHVLFQRSDSTSKGIGLVDIVADVFLDTRLHKIGTIHAVLVDRPQIPENCFYMTFDQYSGDLEWVGSSILENYQGHTKLASLRDHDDPESAFLYITSLDIGENMDSDIAAVALHKFLWNFRLVGSPTERRDTGDLRLWSWRVTSAAYVLTRFNEEREQDEDENKELAARKEAEPFLRNGFFQDQSLIQSDYDNQRILVASCGHWEESLLSKDQLSAATARFALYVPPKLSYLDRSILKVVQQIAVRGCLYVISPNVARKGGSPEYKSRPRDPVSCQQLMSLQSQISQLVLSGGSIARSTAVHAACEKNSPSVVKLLLEMDPAGLNARNARNHTPLMVAAKAATERCSINNGIDDTTVINTLLSFEADRSATDSIGMTAYCHFRKTSKQMIQVASLRGRGNLFSLENKLRPSIAGLLPARRSCTSFIEHEPNVALVDQVHARGFAGVDYACY